MSIANFIGYESAVREYERMCRHESPYCPSIDDNGNWGFPYLVTNDGGFGGGVGWMGFGSFAECITKALELEKGEKP